MAGYRKCGQAFSPNGFIYGAGYAGHNGRFVVVKDGYLSRNFKDGEAFMEALSAAKRQKDLAGA